MKRLITLIIIVLLPIESYFITGYLLRRRYPPPPATFLTPIPEKTAPVILPSPTEPDIQTLHEILKAQLNSLNDPYAIVVKDLENSRAFSVNGATEFQSASLYKLWVMAYMYSLIDNGKINKDDVLRQDVTVLNRKFNIDPEVAELSEGTIRLTVSEALRKMITISDNYAAMLLSEKAGISKIQAYISKEGFSQSKLGTASTYPETTASDIALFFDKLYRKELATPESTEEMLTLLKAQEKNDKLPKKLPEDTVIAHKTGELFGFSHDAGIVYTSTGNYIIVIMTESKTPSETDKVISDISKSVYDFMTDSD